MQRCKLTLVDVRGVSLLAGLGPLLLLARSSGLLASILLLGGLRSGRRRFRSSGRSLRRSLGGHFECVI